LIVRNAGGNIERNIDDLIFLDQLLGLKEVLLIKHTSKTYPENEMPSRILTGAQIAVQLKFLRMPFMMV
jgi:hypothetical protein